MVAQQRIFTIFHCRLPKTAFNSIFFYLFIILKNRKIIVWKNGEKKKKWKYSQLKFVEFHVHGGKDCLCFNKSSVDEIFTFISSQVVSETSHISSVTPLGSEICTSIKCSVSLQDD